MMTETAPPTPDSAAPFHRAGGRHRFTARAVEVVAVERLGDEYVRVTLGGPELHDFASTGPSDHVRVFFPDPDTGVLIAPVAVGPEEEGIVRPDRPALARDFTPLHPRDEAGGRRFDLDILLHEDPGPAARWGASAVMGDRLVVVGPRGSRGATQNAPRVLCIVDGTSLPAAARWLAEVPASTRVDVIADVEGDLGWVRAYLQATGRSATVIPAGVDLVATLRSAGIDGGTFLFAAGEASRLVDVRRFLRRDLELPADQFQLSGYWKQGASAFDHHAPIDPDDAD